MSSSKSSIHPSISSPVIHGRPQSTLESNEQRKPAITPRREYSALLQQFPIWMLPRGGSTFPPPDSGTIQVQ